MDTQHNRRGHKVGEEQTGFDRCGAKKARKKDDKKTGGTRDDIALRLISLGLSANLLNATLSENNKGREKEGAEGLLWNKNHDNT